MDMATKRRLSASVAAAILLSTSVSPALAQATVAEVQADLQTSCVADANGAVVDSVSCLAAVQRAIDSAAIYAANGLDQPQVDIGFLIGQIMVSFPALAQAIVDLIDATGNALLALGASNALPPDWTGPVPIISPA